MELIVDKDVENWKFITMWPFKKKSIRRIGISIDYLDPDLEKELGPRSIGGLETYNLYLDDDEYYEKFDEVYELMNVVVSKIKMWNKQHHENEERAEFERLKLKYG